MSNINEKWGEWAKAPAPIPAEELTRVIETDVAIVGAGFAGVTCSLRAAQMGVKVVVLEQSSSFTACGANIGIINSSFLKSQGYENDPAEVAREWIKLCGNRCDEKILWCYLKNGGTAMDWLIDIITRPEYGSQPALRGCAYKGETYREIVSNHSFKGGKTSHPAEAAVDAMNCEAVKLGAQYIYKTRGERLLKEDGRVTGVIARDEDGYLLIRAKLGVVLATGNINGHKEMCEDLAPVANRCASRPYWKKGGNLGDGHRMGLWAGGAFEDTPFPAVMHPQAFHHANYFFLHVKPDGTRFMNEDNFVQGKSVALIRERLQYAWAIADSAWAEKVPPSLEYGGGMFWGQDGFMGDGFDIEKGKQLFENGIKNGVVVKADTPAELARLMDVPQEGFVKTFERYNELVAKGKDEDFGKRKELLVGIDKPPYYGMKFGPACLAVVGGLRVDTKMRVLSENGDSIDGLYAIGNTAGGRYGVDYPLHVAGNSLGFALTFGYLLGESFG